MLADTPDMSGMSGDFPVQLPRAYLIGQLFSKFYKKDMHDL